MIDGKFWPISHNRISDGYGLCLKNAKKLLNVSIEQFKKDPPDYALSIFLAASAIEETGKGIMLMSLTEKNIEIDAEKWKKKFEDHKTKITAAIDHISEFVEKNDKIKNKAVNEIREDLIRIKEEKFASIYLDWDATNNDWAFFDELSTTVKRKKAEKALKAAKWIITGYIKDGKMITERNKVVLEMVKQKLAIAECATCNFKSHDFKEISQHSKSFKDHKIGFREI